MTLLDDRPDSIDRLIRAGNSYDLALTFEDSLAGRTFTSTLGGEDLAVVVVGDVMTVTASATLTADLPVGVGAEWLLVEDIGGVVQVALVGVWTPDDRPQAGTSSAVTVSAGASQATVTVPGAGAVAALDTRVTAAEGDIDDLESADTAHFADNTAHGNPLGALSTHEASTTAHGNPLGALSTHEASTTAHGDPLAQLSTHESDDTAHGNPLGALATHQASTTAHGDPLAALASHGALTGAGSHVPSVGTEGQVLLAANSAAVWARPRLEALAHHPGVNRWRQKLAVSRMGGFGALSAIVLVVGDSRVRGNATLYRGAWIDRLRTRFLGATPGSYGFLPASGSLGQVTDGGWPGGDNPWTFTGAVTGSVNYGLGFHAAVIPTAGTASFTYFGDKATLFYTRTAAGPTAAAVTIDGVTLAPLNARGTELAGQQAQYGTNGNYGFHTMVVTPNDGPLTLEGAQWFDGDAPVFVSGSVQMFDCSHAGYQAAMFGTSAVNNNWSAMLAGADAFFGCGLAVFDVNDIAQGRTPAQFRDDLVDITARVDARLGTSTLSWLFPMLPASVDTTAYVQAARDAAALIGSSRAAVLDVAALRPGRVWGSDLSADGTHPNDAGHIWLADVLGSVLDPTPSTTVPTTPKRTIIDASTPTDGRLSWTETWTALTGVGGYDQSGGGTTVGERRHRVWLDPGTYRATVTMQEDTGLGTVEVLIGRWVSNTPTLTSCGTKANAAGTPTLVTTRLGTSVTTALGGWHPVVIRKTSASGAIRFVQLVIDKTA